MNCKWVAGATEFNEWTGALRAPPRNHGQRAADAVEVPGPSRRSSPRSGTAASSWLVSMWKVGIAQSMLLDFIFKNNIFTLELLEGPAKITLIFFLYIMERASMTTIVNQFYLRSFIISFQYHCMLCYLQSFILLALNGANYNNTCIIPKTIISSTGVLRCPVMQRGCAAARLVAASLMTP